MAGQRSKILTVDRAGGPAPRVTPRASATTAGHPAQTPASHLSRELELLETALRAAERIALSTHAIQFAADPPLDSDISSRRAELDRREAELLERERAIQRQQELLELARERLQRGKESLNRAIARFRSQAAQRTEQLVEREARLQLARSELVEARREFAREQMLAKATLRSCIRTPRP